jgi:signal transduction histidine kinase/CheY-like chemotaxis protein
MSRASTNGSRRSMPVTILAGAILIVLIGILVIFQNDRATREARADFARSQAQILAASAAAAVDFNDPIAAQEAVDPFRVNGSVRWTGIYGRDGRLIAGYDRTGEAVPSTEDAIQRPDANAIRVSAPVQMAGQRIGAVQFEIDREPVWRRLSRYAMLAILILAASLIVVALGFGQVALRNANRQLADRAEALSQANELLEEQMEERAKAEDQLRQSHKMQALGQLTGGIAHDFNNLLTVIQGSADMLCRPELPEPKRTRFAQAIVQASENAASLTSQLLAFARRQPLKPEQIDVNELIREMRDLIDRTVSERIEVATKLEAVGCCIVEVDKAQLQSAILNIASNARDAMDDGGLLTIRTREEEGGLTGRMIAIEISDSGRGMDADTLDRMFEPFFTTKGTGRGTGLGLSQVYGFASQSGGEVRATSEVGQGTTFTLLLPCHDGLGGSPASKRADNGLVEHQAVAILVVEDNEEVGVFAENLLSELGHNVTRVTSGEEALELCRTRPFDVVFSDVVMPGMGGLKLAEILADEKPELPVVLATGYSQEIAEVGSGGRPVILKPYRLGTLSEALAEAIRGGPLSAK